jgi:3,4-dihydroxy-9,10-secoandrosta-1,3,5(10)-triene-9,17-dione 4,5-dioxygenase
MMKICGLAYVVVQGKDLQAWRRYAEQVLGMMCADAPGCLRVKMDERQFRIAVLPGSSDRYVASGWEVLDAAAFQQAIETLEAARVPYVRGSEELARQRCVQQLVHFDDPSGNRHEVVWGFSSDFTRFVSPVGVPRFITGGIGMGHTVLPAPNFEATARFVEEVMGFGLSDLMNFRPAGADGPSLPIHFMHCANGRHHSLGLAGFPVDSGCVHIMVEVDDMAEVGRAMDRVAALSVPLSATLGQHTNDRMTSFYMKSPSNFDVEFGYGGAVCDWDRHAVHEFTQVSLWGHDFSIGRRG